MPVRYEPAARSVDWRSGFYRKLSRLLTAVVAAAAIAPTLHAMTVLDGDQVIRRTTRWNNDDYEIRGQVSVVRGGRLMIGTAGNGHRCEIRGKLTVEQGGRVEIGYKPRRGNCDNVCTVFGDVELQGDGGNRTGTLMVKNATMEVAGEHQGDRVYDWSGGKLITSHGATIGGASVDGLIHATLLKLDQGVWECSNTTVRYIAGILVESAGRLYARDIRQGDIPDAIHAYSGAEIYIRDSTYDILFTADFTNGGDLVLDLPVDERISYWDASAIPGADYTLQLRKSRVTLWWFHAMVASRMDAPAARVVLRDCPFFGMHLSGSNLREAEDDQDASPDFELPVSWSKDDVAWGMFGFTPPWDGPIPMGYSWDTGNLHWVVGDKPAGLTTWGLYPSEPRTDLKIQGPSRIAELLFSEGNVSLAGTPGTYDMLLAGWFFAVGSDGTKAELSIENASMGIFDPSFRSWKGEFVADGGARVSIRDTRIGLARLRTEQTATIFGQGGVCLVELEGAGTPPDYEEIANGGPIEVDPVVCK